MQEPLTQVNEEANQDKLETLLRCFRSQLCGWEGFGWVGPLSNPLGILSGEFLFIVIAFIFLFQHEIFKKSQQYMPTFSL